MKHTFSQPRGSQGKPVLHSYSVPATSTLAGRRARLRLAAVSQSRLVGLAIAPADAPELPLQVSFEGLTPEEQRAALAAFPGGKRFVLVA